MKRIIQSAVLTVLAGILGSGHADGRGFGGFRAGGFSGGVLGGFRAGGFGGFDAGGFRAGGGAAAFGGDTRFGGSYSGIRSGGTYSGGLGGVAGGSYDRSFSGAGGGSINVSGDRGAVRGPLGGFAAGGSRDVNAVGPDGRSYSGTKHGGVAVGPYGRVVGGGSKAGIAAGPGGVVAGGSKTAFTGARFPTDVGLAHYSSFNTTAVGHSTAFWSHSYIADRVAPIRMNFGYYNCFRPAWYTAHPGAWYAAGWAAGAAWTAATWSLISTWCAIPAAPVYYDYGSTVVYQYDSVYVNGLDVGTAQTYAQQATTLADQGQQAQPAPKEEWKALGVFALAQGSETTSNNLFQLAVNKDGVIRGNYYDGLMDTTTPVYGSVDKKTQRAAWTIGKKNDRVFETGIYNLTKSETPLLVHFGTDRTQQWLLVRVEQTQTAK